MFPSLALFAEFGTVELVIIDVRANRIRKQQLSLYTSSQHCIISVMGALLFLKTISPKLPRNNHCHSACIIILLDISLVEQQNPLFECLLSMSSEDKDSV